MTFLTSPAVHVVSRSGSCRTVAGLSQVKNGAVRIDPFDHSIWIGEHVDGPLVPGRLSRIRLRGLQASDESVVAPFVGVCGAGIASAIDANDAPPGSLRSAPMQVPTARGRITLELGLVCPPGHAAVIAVVRPATFLVAAGQGDAGGIFAVAVPGVEAAAGTPDVLSFLGASIDPTTLTVTISNEVRWPGN